jgi:hypothetical protein
MVGKSSRNVIGLITATFSPQSDMTHVAISDPAKRISEYRKSLRHLVKPNSFDAIYFVENSNGLSSDAGQLFLHEFHDNINFLSVDVTDVSALKGKGHMELHTILRAINTIQPNANDIIVKITGRYEFLNHIKYTECCRETSASVLCSMQKNLTLSDTRVFAATVYFINTYLKNYLDVIDDDAGIYIEHALARAVHLMLADTNKGWSLPTVKPALLGVSGSIGNSMQSNRMTVLLGAALHLIRRAIIAR